MTDAEKRAQRELAWRTSVARFDQEIVDLETVVDDQVKLCRRLQLAMRNEILGEDGSIAAKNLAVSESAVKKLKELTNAITAAVAAHNALLKSAKERATKMTPQELQAGLQRAVLSMGSEARRTFLFELAAQHNKRRRAAIEEGLEDVLRGSEPDKYRVELL